MSRVTVHTLAFVREEQPTLFLAIMFAATRFFHPTAHPLIKQLLETKISESTKTGNCHIATIQAIIILVFWQEPKDRSVWLKSGLAIRMAYQAGLNRTPGMSTSNRSISDIRRLRVSLHSIEASLQYLTSRSCSLLVSAEWATYMVLQVVSAGKSNHKAS